MNPLSKRELLIIENYCLRFICRDFSCMLNKEYRGPNFRWDNYKNNLLCNIEVYMHIYISVSKKKKPAYVDYAKEFSARVVENMLKDSGLVDLL